MAVANYPFPIPTGPLPTTDGEPLESEWHVLAIHLLLDVVRWFLRNVPDWFAGGNMFLYYSADQVRNQDYCGPDFFVVKGVPRDHLRPYYAVWEEGGRFPNLIIELLSPTTAEGDRTTKKRLYERTFRTPEYFLYDPATATLEGYRLGPAGRYRKLRANRQGRIKSEELGLWLGPWTGVYNAQRAVWLRCFTDDDAVVLYPAEDEKRRAETERQRADAAEAEVARLRALLAQQRDPPNRPNGSNPPR